MSTEKGRRVELYVIGRKGQSRSLRHLFVVCGQLLKDRKQAVRVETLVISKSLKLARNLTHSLSTSSSSFSSLSQSLCAVCMCAYGKGACVRVCVYAQL